MTRTRGALLVGLATLLVQGCGGVEPGTEWAEYEIQGQVYRLADEEPPARGVPDGEVEQEQAGEEAVHVAAPVGERPVDGELPLGQSLPGVAPPPGDDPIPLGKEVGDHTHDEDEEEREPPPGGDERGSGQPGGRR